MCGWLSSRLDGVPGPRRARGDFRAGGPPGPDRSPVES